MKDCSFITFDETLRFQERITLGFKFSNLIFYCWILSWTIFKFLCFFVFSINFNNFQDLESKIFAILKYLYYSSLKLFQNIHISFLTISLAILLYFSTKLYLLNDYSRFVIIIFLRCQIMLHFMLRHFSSTQNLAPETFP